MWFIALGHQSRSEIVNQLEQRYNSISQRPEEKTRLDLLIHRSIQDHHRRANEPTQGLNIHTYFDWIRHNPIQLNDIDLEIYAKLKIEKIVVISHNHQTKTIINSEKDGNADKVIFHTPGHYEGCVNIPNDLHQYIST